MLCARVLRLSASTLPRRLSAEFAGTGLLLAAVVGSGIMAERLSDGQVALALLANATATGSTLAALIVAFASVSGAHFNPIVSVVDVLRRGLSARDCSLYVAAQIGGAVLGVMAAHVMFELPASQIATQARPGAAQWFSESVATFGLIAVIWSGARHGIPVVAVMVGAYITGAYWFTASTSFANPAVTIARALTDTFAGIRPGDVPGFVAAQAAGGGLGFLFLRWLHGRPRPARTHA